MKVIKVSPEAALDDLLEALGIAADCEDCEDCECDCDEYVGQKDCEESPLDIATTMVAFEPKELDDQFSEEQLAFFNRFTELTAEWDSRVEPYDEDKTLVEVLETHNILVQRGHSGMATDLLIKHVLATSPHYLLMSPSPEGRCLPAIIEGGFEQLGSRVVAFWVRSDYGNLLKLAKGTPEYESQVRAISGLHMPSKD